MGQPIIYVLRDPRTAEVRYVGKTTGSLSKRLSKHIYIARTGRNIPVSDWIRKLLGQGLKPTIEAIEMVARGVEWEGRERFWIAYYRQRTRLMNYTDGGEGGWTIVDVAAWREKQRKSSWRKGRRLSEEAKRRISESNRGKHRSEQTRKLLSQIRTATKCKRGHPFTPENTLYSPRRGRTPAKMCKICRNELKRQRRRKLKNQCQLVDVATQGKRPGCTSCVKSAQLALPFGNI